MLMKYVQLLLTVYARTFKDYSTTKSCFKDVTLDKIGQEFHYIHVDLIVIYIEALQMGFLRQEEVSCFGKCFLLHQIVNASRSPCFPSSMLDFDLFHAWRYKIKVLSRRQVLKIIRTMF